MRLIKDICVILLSAIIALTLYSLVPLLAVPFGYHLVYMEGTSMYPEIAPGDLVLVWRGNFSVGDVVVFRIMNETVMHRVNRLEKVPVVVNGTPSYQLYVCTRGDSPNSTAECFHESLVLFTAGKNPVRLPLAGYFYWALEKLKSMLKI
jgi:signal peptidase I